MGPKITLRVLSKIKDLNPLIVEINKLTFVYKELFDEMDVWILIEKLQNELEFMLTCCVKYKSGRIQLKSFYDLDELKETPERYNNYEGIYDDRWMGYYINQREPGMRRHGSQNSSDFSLLSQEYIMIDGDLYKTTEEEFGRVLHLNRLRWLAVQKRTKVVSEKIERFVGWMETLSLFKHDLYKFGGNNGGYSGNEIEDGTCSNAKNVVGMVMNEMKSELSMALLPKFKKRMEQLSQEKKEALIKGRSYLSELKKENLAARTLSKIKGN